MHTSEWRFEPGSMTTWTKVMRGSEQDGDLEIVAKTYSIAGYSAEDVAKLIAAAPEMLAVCRAISNDLSLFQFTDGEYRLSEQTANVILQSLRLVIDKAEGKCA